MMTDSKGHEEGSENAAGVEDFLMIATNRVWSALQEDPDKISTISIWGWDGIGRSIITNKIMEEAKKEGEAYFYDVVIPVSVPQSEDDVTNMREQPTSPDSKMAYVARIPAQETFEEEFPEEKRKKIEFRPLLTALADGIKKALKIPEEREEIERITRPSNENIGKGKAFEVPDASSKRWPEIESEAKEIQTGLEEIAGRQKWGLRKREEQKEKERLYLQQEIARIRGKMMMEFDKQVNTVRDEGSKQLGEASRRFEEEAEMKLSKERQRSLSERREYEEKIRRLEEKAEMELSKERRRSEEMIRRLEEEIRRLEEKAEMELSKEKQRSEEVIRRLEEDFGMRFRRRSEEMIQRFEEEFGIELSKERRRSEEMIRRSEEEFRRELSEERRRSEERIRRLEEEGRRQLKEERWKARKTVRQRELQAKIVAELMINVGQSTHTAAVADVLRNWLASRTFLLILRDVWENIDLQEIGIPLSAPGNGSKVVIIPFPSAEEAVQEQMQATVIKEKFSSLSDPQAWQLLKAEAMDAATTLPKYPSIIMSTSSILECFSYVSLFPSGGNIVSLKELWRSEGFFDELIIQLQRAEGGEERAEQLVYMIVDALLVQLYKRCMLTSFHGKFQMPDGIWRLVSSLKGLLIRCDSDSEMLPSSNEWEGAVRISLSRNTQIHELPMKPLVSPPNCPKLHTLILNDNDHLISISPNFFENMTSLQVLDLSSTAINSLPTSISGLHKLRMLNLGCCGQLEDLPEFMKHMQKLEVLDLRWTPIKRTSLDGMPCLRRLDISRAKYLTQLSVNGCGSLSILNGLEGLSKLEDLDLSGTKINQLPHQIFNTSSLKRLHLLRMQHFQKIPWGRIVRLPEQLQWHQCRSYSLKEQFPDDNRRLISATDAALFDSLGPDSKLSESHLQNFYFLVCPCESRPKDRFADFKTGVLPYQRVYASHAISARPDRFLRCSRCIEVCGGKAPIDGIWGVLLMADSFCLRGHEFITKVFDLRLKVGNVRECWIEKCNQLECVIDLRGGRAAADIMGSLENLWLSDLPQLTTVCKGIPRNTSPAWLKHLYVERCPRLFYFFSSNIQFQKLESLEIKFCPRLENVCGDDNVVGQDAFPQLAEIRLWELSKLKRICKGHLPMLKKLKIRGCPMLGNLPLRNEATSAAAAIEIEGETKWWESIRWEGGAKPRNICFKDCSSFKA